MKNIVAEIMKSEKQLIRDALESLKRGAQRWDGVIDPAYKKGFINGVDSAIEILTEQEI